MRELQRDCDTLPTTIQWQKSEASRLLNVDIDADKHQQLKPADLYATREDYQAFTLKVFRYHIYQEVDML